MKVSAAILLFVVYFSSCTGQTPALKNLNAEEFEKGIARENIQIIDVRTPQEYNDKHIRSSKNININDANFEKEFLKLDKSKPVYVYCLAGSRSTRAGEFAAKNGFNEVYNLEGGMNAWMGSKKPIESSAGHTPGSGMSFDDYLNHLKSRDKLVLVDFNAVWCGPCKILKPIVNKAIKKNSEKAELFEIDVDKNPNISATMHITGIPLLVLYKQGKEVWRTMGLTDEETINSKLQEFAK